MEFQGQNIGQRSTEELRRKLTGFERPEVTDSVKICMGFSMTALVSALLTLAFSSFLRAL
jgi:hypothetical protein